ncbi:MAG: putative transcription factor, MBF1 like protein [Clostridium sp. Maddingley MBC34-26]|nr:MAG: putative transcription factor, MBF1 like protein [Clostridium sp. Maddingley MBC34-26]
MNYKQIGQRIRNERAKLNLNREKFAEILELSTNFVGQIERGEKKMSLDTLVKISDCLHISLDFLIRGKDISPDKTDTNKLHMLINKCSQHEISLITDVIKAMLPHLKNDK